MYRQPQRQLAHKGNVPGSTREAPGKLAGVRLPPLGETNCAHVARFGSASSDTVVNPDAALDLRYMKRCEYKYMWELQKRIADADERMDALLEC